MKSMQKALKPDATIQKALISTTSRLFGEYNGDEFLITHAWNHTSGFKGNGRMEESPISRNAFIVAFRTSPVERKSGVVLPNYSYMGDIICSYLAILFGKRFDNHGLIESTGFYNVPDLSAYNNVCNHRLLFNSHQERKCFGVELNLVNLKPIEELLTNQNLDGKFVRILQICSKFYLQALQIVEHDAEIAYLHLITSAEILSGFYDYENDDLIDSDMMKTLQTIRDTNGEKVSKMVQNRLLSIKRRFVKTICSLIDDDFFINTETEHEYSAY